MALSNLPREIQSRVCSDKVMCGLSTNNRDGRATKGNRQVDPIRNSNIRYPDSLPIPDVPGQSLNTRLVD
jgi:hypothetical protein